MKAEELYKNQYADKKLKIDSISFKWLRKVFKKYDIHREDVAIALLEKGDNLLDIGCGEGFLLLKAKNKYTNLYGLDIVPHRLEIARNNFKKEKIETRVILKTSNINEGLGFEDNFFDAVTIIATLPFIYDPFFTVKEINRILKNGGILIVQVANIAYIKYRIKLLFGKLPITTSPYNWEKIGWEGGALHYFTLSYLRWLLESHGFKIEKVTGSGLFAKLRSWWPSLLNGDICIKTRKIK
jgi:SAM-dependent methyltransferase